MASPNTKDFECFVSVNDSELREHGGSEIRPRTTEGVTKYQVLYTVNECPPWYTCLILGFQHFLLMVVSTMAVPYIMIPYMCMSSTDKARGAIASTSLFVAGLTTLLQTTIGVRLPIVQGATHVFIAPILAMFDITPCPSDEELSAMSSEERERVWMVRMNQVQGAFCVASVFQIFLGMTGIIGYLLKWITPTVIATTVALIGMSLFSFAVDKAATNWGISSLTVLLLIIFSQYLANIGIPCYSFSGSGRSKFYLFKLFPVIIAASVAWLVCFILTVTDYLDRKDAARTDVNIISLYEAPWFRIPYPGQWGMPTVTISGVLGMMAGILASIIESVGDYFACARIAGAPPPPSHAINRGVVIEGIGTTLSGLFGSGCATTSYSGNIGAITVTGVGSLRVVQYSAGIMILCGMVGKIGSLFTSIPEPIIGGIFIFFFGMITAVGLSSLQFVNLNVSRNLLVIGLSIFIGFAIPDWLQREENQNAIQTSIPELDQVLSVLLKTSMFVGGFLAFVLDNTMPGPQEEEHGNVCSSGSQGYANACADTKDVNTLSDDETKVNSNGTWEPKLDPPLGVRTEDYESDVDANDYEVATEEAKARESWANGTAAIADAEIKVERSDSSEDHTTSQAPESCYDIPFGMAYLRQHKWTSRIPILPTFMGLCQPTEELAEKTYAS